MATILHRLYNWAQADPGAPAIRYKKGEQWQTVHAQQYWQNVFALALYLEKQGFGKHDVGAIFSYNRPEWVYCELAFTLLGGKSVGLYPNLAAKDIQYILKDTGAKILALENQEYYSKLANQGEYNLPSTVKLPICFDDNEIDNFLNFDQLLSEGLKLAQTADPQKYLQRLQAQHGAFLLYTSGTTGKPKGAVLSHHNIVFTTDAIMNYLQLKSGASTFSFLPLCHIAEKLQNIGFGISGRYTVNYCSKFENVGVELAQIQPTVLLCVPRLWEKMMEGVCEKIATAKPHKKKLVNWAMRIGTQVSENKFLQKRTGVWLHIRHAIAKKLVLTKIRKALGIAQSEICASGAAALPVKVNKWFRGLGVEIVEAFGQTESTGVICLTPLGKDCAGTVGKPLPNVEFKIAEDGEILTRGEHVFVEYLNKPEVTAKTLIDGWLHTGDLAEITAHGFVRIRGRKKEIFKDFGWKNGSTSCH